MSRPAPLRFIADAMLGRLARWLRILGFDTIYIKDISDSELVRIARSEGRILLTRDTHLIKDYHLKDYVLLHSNDIYDQIYELHSRHNLLSGEESRCAKCNGMIEKVQKETIVHKVPDYIYLHFTSFWQCIDCGNVYWEGSHMVDFDRKIFKVLSH